MPGVEPIIFIEKVQTEEDGSDLYCFQDTVSFVRYGYATEYSGEEEIGIIAVPPTALVDIYSLECIVNEMHVAISRSKERGEPTLKKTKGSWI